MVHDRDARALGHAVQEGRGQLTRPLCRQGDRVHDDVRTACTGGPFGCEPHGSVPVVADEDLIARPQPDRTQDRVHRGRGVRDEHEPARVSSQKLRRVEPRLLQRVRQHPPEEAAFRLQLGRRHEERRLQFYGRTSTVTRDGSSGDR